MLKIHTVIPTLSATLRLLASPVTHEEIKSKQQGIKELASGVWVWADGGVNQYGFYVTCQYPSRSQTPVPLSSASSLLQFISQK